MVFTILAIVVYVVQMSFISIFLVFVIWFLPLFSYMILEYTRYKKYIETIKGILEGLDEKYLLPEVIPGPESWIEREIDEILKETGRQMHE